MVLLDIPRHCLMVCQRTHLVVHFHHLMIAMVSLHHPQEQVLGHAAKAFLVASLMVPTSN